VRDPEALFLACVEALSAGGQEMQPGSGLAPAGGGDARHSDAAIRTREVVKALATWLGPPLVPRAGDQPVNHAP